MSCERRYPNELLIGIVGVAETPEQSARVMGAIETCCRAAFLSPIQIVARPVINELYSVEDTLRELSDKVLCDVIFTAGATGLTKADIVPQATRLVSTYEIPGLGEQMRRIQARKNRATMLSRQTAGLRETPEHDALIVNLPALASDIPDTLRGLFSSDGTLTEPGIFDCLTDFLEQVDGPTVQLREFGTSEEETEASETPMSLHRPEPETRFPTSYSQAAAAARESTHREEVPPVASPRPVPTSGFTEHRVVHPRMSQEAIERRSVQRGVRLVSDTNRHALEPLDLLIEDPEDGLKPECTVVWLHGMGTSPEDFSPFAREVLDFGGPKARFILPRAPRIGVTVQNRQLTTAWYDILAHIGQEPEDLPGLKSMHLRISQIINQIVSQGIPAETIFLGGFSQGAAMALYSGLRQARTLAGVIALSGYLPAPELLDADITPAGKMTPFFMGHGAFDEIISLIVARKQAALIESKVDTLVWREYNMEHEVAPDEMKHVVQFMSAALHG